MVEELKNTPLLILAGGKGTRLKGLGVDTPKYLMPLDDKTCFADFHLHWAKSQGFSRVILSLGHLAEKIQKHCGQGERYGLEISYLLDGDEPLGTGGAVAKALSIDFDILAITYGDTILGVEAKSLYRSLKNSNAQALMSIYENQVPGHRSNCHFNAPWVVYNKTNPNPSWRHIDYGFLLMRRSAIQGFPTQTPLDLAEPLGTLSSQKLVLGSEITERFWEIGSPEALEEFREHFGFRL
jgi:NDP-sugar pyrophosphorylase family protein